ncbi:MAG: DNA-directed RNA polymerase subunit omega [Firmicutes bacterium]|nr:DNA-directed RNA polymerase subunit omega [Bacillota bacterium]
MNKPSLDELLKRTEQRYLLVVAAAKRARMITDEKREENSVKPVSTALQEIASGRLKISTPKDKGRPAT